MTKKFGIYTAAWAIALALFNVCAFVPPHTIDGVNRLNGSFFAGYVAITLCFLLQLGCAYFAFKPQSLQRTFYQLSLSTVSYAGLALMLVVGGLCMLIVPLPYWLGIVACVIVLGVTVIAILKATTAVAIVSELDEKIATQTAFIKLMTARAEALMNSTTSPELRRETKEVYEAIRYSDPMHNAALDDDNERLRTTFQAFVEAVEVGDLALATEWRTTLLGCVACRNAACKALK